MMMKKTSPMPGKRPLPRVNKATLQVLALAALLALACVWEAGDSKGRQVELPVVRGVFAPQEAVEPSEAVPTSSSFVAYKKEKSQSLDKAIQMLDELLQDAGASLATLDQARAEKLALAKALAMEASLESLLSARGYGEALVSVRPGSVNVVLRTKGLSDAQSAGVLEMVMRETGEAAPNIKIMAAK